MIFENDRVDKKFEDLKNYSTNVVDDKLYKYMHKLNNVLESTA